MEDHDDLSTFEEDQVWRDRDMEDCCAFPEKCLCPHPYHERSECFTAEDAEQMALENDARERREG